MIELLESRRLFSGITHTGTLVIDGTGEADEIHVSRNAGTIFVNQTNSIGVRTSYAAAAVKRILIQGGGGNDVITIDLDVNERATVVGGAGNDEVTGNYGSTLIGGSGNDHLAVPPRRSYDSQTKQTLVQARLADKTALLSGGTGNDVLVGDQSDDFVGGKGFDEALVEVQYQPAVPNGANVNPAGEDLVDTDAAKAHASGVESFPGIFVQFGVRDDALRFPPRYDVVRTAQGVGSFAG